MQVVLVYLQAFRRNSLLKCALQPKITKNPLPRFGVEGRFRVVQNFKLIDVDKSKKPAISPCYAHVCTYLQPYSNRRANSGKITFLGVPLFDVLVRRKLPHPGARNFVAKN